MKFCTNDAENWQVQTYILTGPFFKKKVWKFQNDWKKKSELILQLLPRENWQQIYDVREKILRGDTDKVYTAPVQASIERLP